ncbi:hypothetical protein ACIO3O_32105 [Streptomyces sp. NPDC087440]|uniref:hypothetical protein n=1 Tax=Streptomyces sp. NPDC087440 TaxID=3365790 RepID=UPI0037F6A46A
MRDTQPTATPTPRPRTTATTDAGMLALWDPEHFTAVVDHDTWENELLEDEDIARHIEAGAFVPLNVGGDGTFEVAVRVGTTAAPARPTAREAAHTLVTSDPYLFVSPGGAHLGGIETVGSDGYAIPLSPGRHTVTVHLIDWEAEPGSRTLPDFLVLLTPVSPVSPWDGRGTPFRTSVQTFDPPEH